MVAFADNDGQNEARKPLEWDLKREYPLSQRPTKVIQLFFLVSQGQLMGLFNFLFGSKPRSKSELPKNEASDGSTETEDAKLVDEAIKLIQCRQLEQAAELLRGILSRVPANYRHEEERDGKLYIRFWDLHEFMGYLEWMFEQGTSRDVVWISNAYARAAYFLGYISIECGAFEEAIRYLDRGLRLQPGSVNLVNEKGQALIRLGRLQEAMTLYETQLNSQCYMSRPERAILLRGRGYIQIEQGKLDLAEATYLQSLVLDPDSQTARGQLMYIEMQRASRREASGRRGQ